MGNVATFIVILVESAFVFKFMLHGLFVIVYVWHVGFISVRETEQTEGVHK